MTILLRERVRAAVERALLLEPFSRDQEKGLDEAVRAAAQALGIDEAVVREAIEGEASGATA